MPKVLRGGAAALLLVFALTGCAAGSAAPSNNESVDTAPSGDGETPAPAPEARSQSGENAETESPQAPDEPMSEDENAFVQALQSMYADLGLTDDEVLAAGYRACDVRDDPDGINAEVIEDADEATNMTFVSTAWANLCP